MRNGNKLKSYLVVFAPSRAYILDGSEEGVHILYSRFMRKLNHFFFQFQANPNSNPTLRNTRNRSKSKENIRNKNKIISNFGMKIIMKNYKCFILSFLFWYFFLVLHLFLLLLLLIFFLFFFTFGKNQRMRYILSNRFLLLLKGQAKAGAQAERNDWRRAFFFIFSIFGNMCRPNKKMFLLIAVVYYNLYPNGSRIEKFFL